MGLIFYASNQSELPIDSLSIGGLGHGVVHLGEFAVLALFLALATGVGRCGLVVALLIASFYAIMDEFHQLFVPGRHAGVPDVLLDTVVAAVTLALVRVAAMRRHVTEASLKPRRGG